MQESEWEGWELVFEDEVLARLVDVRVDQPWFHCRLIPFPGLKKFMPLFEEELRIEKELFKTRDNARYDEISKKWDEAYQKILDAGLKMREHPGVEDDAIVEMFILHIDGDKAWFRYAI